jgi:hypothetical protein
VSVTDKLCSHAAYLLIKSTACSGGGRVPNVASGWFRTSPDSVRFDFVLPLAEAYELAALKVVATGVVSRTQLAELITWLWCRDQGGGRTNPNPVRGQATRT